MQGKRAPDGSNYPQDDGSYWKSVDGLWYCVTPNGHYGALGKHDITEHEDGTITVSPSILVSYSDAEQLYHGYLEKGVWREC